MALLPLHDICLYAVGHLLETLCEMGRGLVWAYDQRLGGEINGTTSLGDLRCGQLRLVENESLVVALDLHLLCAGSYRDACVQYC